MDAIPTISRRSQLPDNGKFRLFSTSSYSPKSTVLSICFRKKAARQGSIRPVAVQKSEYDVVVVGAGIIGLTIARQFLLGSDLSVAVVDACVPCSGATGAGQGYIWMGHQTPGCAVWELSMRSKQMWENLAESLEHQGLDPFQVLGWKKTGSLLIGRTSKELAMLEKRVAMFSDAGLRAEYLSATALLSKEPEINVGEEGGAAFFPDDCQLDAMRAVSFIEKGNKSFASEGRYAEFYNNPAVCLLRSNIHGEIEAIQTSENILYGRTAIIVAAGAWSGSLMRSLVKSNNVPDVPVKPRKGHLLVLENVDIFQLNHAVMEVGYIDHLATEVSPLSVTGDIQHEDNSSSISMTATTDTMGNLVLGSSRQFSGFSTEVDNSIVKRIWDRAGEFFPTLRKLPLDMFQKKIRVGLRPWMPDGKPIIGPVPGLPKVLLATGHEGGGLCMALGTAEMVADMVLGNTSEVALAPFSVRGRHAAASNHEV